MKYNYIKSLALIAFLSAAAACTNDMEYTDTTATPVTSFYEPVNGKAIKLVASATASVLFEWEASHAGDGAMPQYEVVFYNAGNTSEPIYKVTSDNSGARPMATITHKTLSKVMAAAGVESGQTGTIKWGVLSYAGVNVTQSTVLNDLTLTRFEGFAEIPNQLYLAGNASETGEDLTKARAFSKPDAETFEIFTQLNAGEKFYFAADRDGLATYSLNGTKIIEGNENASSVAETGVYRISLDFSTASASVRQIGHVYMRFTDYNDFTGLGDGQLAFEFKYNGAGVYKSDAVTITTFDTGWSWDPFESRCNFLMVYADGSQITWGPKNPDEDYKPGSLDINTEYFNMVEYAGRVNNKWKLADDWYNVPLVYSLYFNSDFGAYKHFAEIQ